VVKVNLQFVRRQEKLDSSAISLLFKDSSEASSLLRAAGVPALAILQAQSATAAEFS
jgi:hypothetical protein